MIGHRILKLLQEVGQEVTYQKEGCIIFSNHIPQVGILVLEGKIEIRYSRYKSKIVEPWTVIGVQELISHQPYQYSLIAHPNAKVLNIDISALKALEEHGLLDEFLNNLNEDNEET